MKDKQEERQLSLSFDEGAAVTLPDDVTTETGPAAVTVEQGGESAQVFCFASHRAAAADAPATQEEGKRSQQLVQRAIESVRYF